MRIGLDLDNTIIDYSHSFAKVAEEVAEQVIPEIVTEATAEATRDVGIFASGKSCTKAEIKQMLLQKDETGYLWEKLQGLVYGKYISRAEPYPGVGKFLRCAGRLSDVELVIVSHKTVAAHHDPDKTNIRNAATSWLVQHNIIGDSRDTIAVENVHYQPTLDRKVACIKSLQCDVFIDDLEKVLAHQNMPGPCRKIHFTQDTMSPFENYAHWDDICGALFE